MIICRINNSPSLKALVSITTLQRTGAYKTNILTSKVPTLKYPTIYRGFFFLSTDQLSFGKRYTYFVAVVSLSHKKSTIIATSFYITSLQKSQPLKLKYQKWTTKFFFIFQDISRAFCMTIAYSMKQVSSFGPPRQGASSYILYSTYSTSPLQT